MRILRAVVGFVILFHFVFRPGWNFTVHLIPTIHHPLSFDIKQLIICSLLETRAPLFVIGSVPSILPIKYARECQSAPAQL